jgi:hypothetical protein
VSQICALTVLPSIASDLVANSTPIVDLDSRLNSFLVKRERTAFETQVCGKNEWYVVRRLIIGKLRSRTITAARIVNIVKGQR